MKNTEGDDTVATGNKHLSTLPFTVLDSPHPSGA